MRSSGRCGSTIKRILIAIRGFRFTRLSWSLPPVGVWRLYEYGVWANDRRLFSWRLAFPRGASGTVDLGKRF